MQFFMESLLTPVNRALLGTWHIVRRTKRTELRLTEYENLRESNDTKIQNYNVFFDNI